MQQMKRPAEQKIRMIDFRNISAELLQRGFTEDQKKAEQGAMHERMPVASFTRKFSAFSLKVGASQEAADVLDARREGLGDDWMTVSLYAKCSASSDRTVVQFAMLFPHKGHYVEHLQTDLKIYHADLVPYPDAGLLIQNCLALESCIARLKGDVAFAQAIDARVAFDRIAEGFNRIDNGNTLKEYVGRCISSTMQALKQKFDYEFARILGDQLVGQALSQVADR